MINDGERGIFDESEDELKLRDLTSEAGYGYAEVRTSHFLASTLLAAILICEFGVLVIQAGRKPFWYDELLTFHVSSLHPFSLLWQALRAGADGMPPGYYVLVQLVTRLPGDPHVMLRLPSIAGYLLSLIGVYWFAQRTLSGFAGLAAVLFITLSPFRGYALEARSYSLLVGFFAISAVLWQRIDKKRFMIPLFAVFLTLAVCCHHLAVVALTFFGLAELTWTFLSRRIRWGVWAACFLATVPFVVSLPILLDMRDMFGKTFWSRPSWSTAVWTYGSYLGLRDNFAFAVVLFLGLVIADSLLRMLRRPSEDTRDRKLGPPEMIMVGGFLFYPALLAVLTRLLGSGYTPRYGWPAILGLALGFSYVLRHVWLKPTSAYLVAALLSAFAVQSAADFLTLYKAGPPRLDERWTKLAELSRREPGLPVVVGDPLVYLEAAKYSPPELSERLVHIVDTDSAARLVGTDTPHKTNRILAQFVPLHVEDPATFLAERRRFILRSDGGFDWFTQYLVERKYRLELLSTEGRTSFYIAER